MANSKIALEIALTHCRDSRKTIFGFGRIYNPADYNNRIEISNSHEMYYTLMYTTYLYFYILFIMLYWITRYYFFLLS